MNSKQLRRYCPLDEEGQGILKTAMEDLGLSGGQLDGIRAGAYQGLHGFFKIFDAAEKS